MGAHGRQVAPRCARAGATPPAARSLPCRRSGVLTRRAQEAGDCRGVPVRQSNNAEGRRRSEERAPRGNHRPRPEDHEGTTVVPLSTEALLPSTERHTLCRALLLWFAEAVFQGSAARPQPCSPPPFTEKVLSNQCFALPLLLLSCGRPPPASLPTAEADRRQPAAEWRAVRCVGQMASPRSICFCGSTLSPVR